MGGTTAVMLLAQGLFAGLRRKAAGESSDTSTSTSTSLTPTAAERGVAFRFLAVYMVYKLGDWMQGPFFYEVYSERCSDSASISFLFLIGFLSAMAGGAFLGGTIDTKGRKIATIFACILFTLSAWSVTSWDMNVLILGRTLGGIATSLFQTAPEAWLLGECSRLSVRSRFVDTLFGWVYFLDALVAILAGYAAEAAVSSGRSTASFEVSGITALLAAILTATLWSENTAPKEENKAESGTLATLKFIFSRTDILLLGAVQAAFEGSMYVFVLMWGRTLSELSDEKIPFGLVFSCFMTACMVGSSVAGFSMERGVPSYKVLTGGLAVAVGGLALSSLAETAIVAAVGFCFFELAVGVYFPCMGALRATTIPNTRRASVSNWLRVPMNLTVILGMIAYQSENGSTAAHTMILTGLIIAFFSSLFLHAPKEEKAKTQ